jgi:hypothetical protein
MFQLFQWMDDWCRLKKSEERPWIRALFIANSLHVNALGQLHINEHNDTNSLTFNC